MSSCRFSLLLVALLIVAGCRECPSDVQNKTESQEVFQGAESQGEDSHPAEDQWEDEDPELVELMEKLRSKSPEDVSQAFHALVDKESYAIPVLKKGLSDKKTRYACVEILTRLEPMDSVPVLLETLKIAPEVTGKDRKFKSYIIGGLGRLKAYDAVPLLQELYDERNRKHPLIRSASQWALEQVTGHDYGQTYDPWKQGK